MSDIIALKGRAERYYNRGSNASYAGRLPEAVYYLRKAVSEDRRNKRYIIDLISVLNQAGFYEETISYGAEALALEPESADKATVLFHMGEACYCLGLNEASKRYIELCLQTDPEGVYASDAQLYKTELDIISSMEADDEAEEGQSGGGKAQFRQGTDAGIQEKELSVALHISMGNYEQAYKAADELLSSDAGNVMAMLFGYMSAVKTDNTFGKKRYSKLLSGIRDCSEMELQTLCRYFDSCGEDKLAKDVFASIYQENTFWKEAGFALAAAFYNNGELSAAFTALERLKMLDGGGVAELCLKNLRMDNPPERMSYCYAPTAEQMDMLCTELFSLLDSPGSSDDYYILLENDLVLVMRYAEASDLGDVVGALNMENEQIRDIVRRLLLDYYPDTAKKLLLAALLRDAEPDCDDGVNIAGDIIKVSDLTDRFRMRNFTVPSHLEEKFGRRAVGDVYMQLPGIDVLDIDSPDEEYAFAANAVLLSAVGEPIDTPALCDAYGLAYERGKEIMDKLAEKGIV